MILEAGSRSCFSNDYVLHLDGVPIGRWRRRFWSERIDVERRGGPDLVFVKDSFFGGRMALEEAGGRRIGEAFRAGAFTAAWNLVLSVGDVELVSAGWFNTGFDVRRDGRLVATVNRTGFCSGGWLVDADDGFTAEDLILVGLLYSTILRRRASSNTSTAGGA